MSPNPELNIEPTAFLDDIEKRVGEIFSAQKNEVEQSLMEKINREKEEAQKRIEDVNREFAQVRGFLEEHKQAMAELQTSETYLRGEIRGHFERASNYQKMMENAAALAGDELEKIGGLNRELEKVRVKAEEEYAGLKKSLGGYAGIIAKLPAPPASADTDQVDWNEELGKLRRVRDLLATLHQPESSPSVPTANGAETTAPAAHEAEELAASLGLIDEEEDAVRDDAEFVLGTPTRPSPPPRPSRRSPTSRPRSRSRPPPSPSLSPPPRSIPPSRPWPATAGPSPSTTASRSASIPARRSPSSTSTASWPPSARSSTTPASSTPSSRRPLRSRTCSCSSRRSSTSRRS